MPPTCLPAIDRDALAAELAPLFGHDLADQPPVTSPQLKALRAFDALPRLRELAGHTDPMPAVGEKLVCLRNDRVKGLLNGSTWTVHAQRSSPRTDTVRLDVVPEDDPALRRRPVDIKVLKAVMPGSEEEIPAFLKRVV